LSDSTQHIGLQFSVRYFYPTVKAQKSINSVSVQIGGATKLINAVKINGAQNGPLFTKTKNIVIKKETDLYNLNLKDYFKFLGNVYYVDKTLRLDNNDNDKHPIKITDLTSEVFYKESSDFHSFSQGLANSFIIVN
jgi:hypothetical protein